MKSSRLFIKEIGSLEEKLSSLDYTLSCINSFYSSSFTKADFAFGEKGKPYLEKFNKPFNLSHSASLMALLVSEGECEVGLDIQVVRDKYSIDKVAARAFLPDEVEWMKDKENGFFLLWSMKEALIKAHGGSIWDSARYGSVTSRLKEFESYLISFESSKYYLSIYPKQKSLIFPEGYCPKNALKIDEFEHIPN
ncbi:MAG: 4'-phosphopantetheinyl transferase superfamily protein [Sphaerochaetaceae bacterium]|nr:4'-phosphopantetheinyl transferase superfamily protein [Sphaerochaetaceae bacterium]